MPLVEPRITADALGRPRVLLVAGHRRERELTALVRALQLRGERNVHPRCSKAAGSQQLANTDCLHTAFDRQWHIAPAGESMPQVVRFLLETAEASPNVLDKVRRAIHMVATRVTQTFLAAQNDQTALHFACIGGHYQVLHDDC